MRFQRLPFFALTALAVLAICGCGNSPSGPPAPDSDNLSLPFGGYTAANEAPAFGDPDLASSMRDEPLFEDPMFPHNDLETLLDSLNHERHHQIYMLAMRWGQLEGDSSNTVLTDFSGSLKLNRGAIIVRKLLRFEPNEDRIVRPRTSRTLLEWVSQTSVHFDGLLVMIVDPLQPPDSTWPPNQLVFTTGLYTRTFTMPELQTLDEIVTVDLLGNQIAFNARNLGLIACGNGVLDGVWHLNPSKQNGEFSGRWMAADGIFRGHLRGHFGRRPNGEMPFFGKVIGVDGHFAGLLRGTWGFDPNDSALGWFDGTWLSRLGAPEGSVSGQWVSDSTASAGDSDGGDGHGHGHGGGDSGHDRNDRWGKGFFNGSWNRDCSADSSGGS